MALILKSSLDEQPKVPLPNTYTQFDKQPQSQIPNIFGLNLWNQSVQNKINNNDTLGAIGEGTKSVGLGLLKFLQLPQNILFNASSNIASLSEGKGLTGIKDYNSYSDYAKQNNAYDFAEGARSINPYLGTAVDTAQDVLTDPLTYMGGGLVGDFAKAKFANPNIFESAESGIKAVKKLDPLQDTLFTEPIKPSEATSTGNDFINSSFAQDLRDGWNKSTVENPITPQRTKTSSPIFNETIDNGLANKMNPMDTSNTIDDIGSMSSTVSKERKIAERIRTNPYNNEDLKQTLEDIPLRYKPISNNQSMGQASEIIANSGDLKAVNDLITKDGELDVYDIAQGVQLASKLGQSGDVQQALNITKWLAEKSTSNGQKIQILSQLSKQYPEGMLMYAQKVIEKSGLQNKGKAIVDAAKKEIQGAKDDAKKAIEDAVNKVDKPKTEITPEKILVDKISNYIKTPSDTVKEADPIADMVNELFKVAKESPITKESVKNLSDPIAVIADAIKNRQKYSEVWKQAKTVLLEKYGDNENAMQLLESYFDKGIKPPFSTKSFSDAMKQGLKDTGIDWKNIVKDYYNSGADARQTLKDYLIKKSGLSGDDVNSFANSIESYLHINTKNIKDKYVNQLIKKANEIKDPKVKQTYLDMIKEKANMGMFSNENVTQAILDKYNLPYLTADDAKYILDEMSNVNKLADGRQKDIALAKVTQFISDKTPSTFADKAKGIQRISMLANPKTMIRNPVGNVLMSAVSNLSETVATPIDALTSLIMKSDRTVTLPNLVTQAKGFAKGLGETIEDAKLGVDTSLSRDKFELPRGKTFKNNALNAVDNVVKTGLQLGDRPFYQAAYDDALQGYMKLNKLSEPTQEAMTHAKEVADIKTYQDTNAITQAFEGIRKSMNMMTGNKDIGFGNVALPFVRTPANILARALDYSVGGAIKTLDELRKMGGNNFNQRRFVTNLSNTLTGAGILWAGYKLAENGYITGDRDKNPNKSAFDMSNGKIPYSFKIGDNNYSYDWAQPASMLMAIGADIYKSGQNKEQAANVVKDAIMSGGKTLFNISVMQGLQGLTGYGDTTEGIYNTAVNAPLQIIPTILGQTAKATDSTTRTTYNPDETQKLINKGIAKVPFINQTLQPKIDVWGDKVSNPSVPNVFFNL